MSESSFVFMPTRVSVITVTALAIAATSSRTELVAALTAFSRICARRSPRCPGPNAAATGSTVVCAAAEVGNCTSGPDGSGYDPAPERVAALEATDALDRAAAPPPVVLPSMRKTGASMATPPAVATGRRAAGRPAFTKISRCGGGGQTRDSTRTTRPRAAGVENVSRRIGGQAGDRCTARPRLGRRRSTDRNTRRPLSGGHQRRSWRRLGRCQNMGGRSRRHMRSRRSRQHIRRRSPYRRIRRPGRGAKDSGTPRCGRFGARHELRYAEGRHVVRAAPNAEHRRAFLLNTARPHFHDRSRVRRRRRRRHGAPGRAQRGAQGDAGVDFAQTHSGRHSRRPVTERRLQTRRASRSTGGWRPHQAGRARTNGGQRRDGLRGLRRGDVRRRHKHRRRGVQKRRRRCRRPAPGLGGAHFQAGRSRSFAVRLPGRRLSGRCLHLYVVVVLVAVADHRHQRLSRLPRGGARVGGRRVDVTGLFFRAGGHFSPTQHHLVDTDCGRRGVHD